MFKRLLSQNQQRKIAAISTEIETIYGLSNVVLGLKLLELSHRTWEEFKAGPGAKQIDADRQLNSYLGAFLFDLIPETARRLGCSVPHSILTSPAQAKRLAAMSDANFRLYAGVILQNTPVPYQLMGFNKNPEPTAYEILNHDFANGNPIAIAVDRIAKPAANLTRDDWMAWHIREISKARGMGEQYCWSPVMQNPISRAKAIGNFDPDKIANKDTLSNQLNDDTEEDDMSLRIA